MDLLHRAVLREAHKLGAACVWACMSVCPRVRVPRLNPFSPSLVRARARARVCLCACVCVCVWAQKPARARVCVPWSKMSVSTMIIMTHTNVTICGRRAAMSATAHQY